MNDETVWFSFVISHFVLWNRKVRRPVKDDFCNIWQEGVQKEDVQTTCIVNVCFVCVWIWKNSRGAQADTYVCK